MALLLAAVSLVAACSAAPAARSQPSASPIVSPSPLASPTASPAPVDYGPVPAGVPVFYVKPSGAEDWLTAFDWSGKPVGTLKLPTGSGQWILSQAPGGDVVYVNGSFFDRRGAQIGSALPVTDKATPVWADDGSHVCGLRGSSDINATFRYVLWTARIGSTPHDVAAIGPVTQIGQVGESVLACSFSRDLAVVERVAIAWPTDLWLVRLSSGAVVGHRTFASHSIANIVASRDARYLAESTTGEAGGAPASDISSVDSGAVMRTLGHDSAWTFSGDGAAVLVSVAGAHAVYIAGLRGASSTPVSISGLVAYALPKPGGEAFAVFVQGQDGSSSVELVSAAGVIPVAQ